MTVCSSCSDSNVSFSKAQMKKPPAQRKCGNCVLKQQQQQQRQQQIHKNSTPTPSLQSKNSIENKKNTQQITQKVVSDRVLMPYYVKAAAKSICGTLGIRDGDQIISAEEQDFIYKQLYNMSNENTENDWLVGQLLVAFINFHVTSFIQNTLDIEEEKHLPLLCLLCQSRALKSQLGFTYGDYLFRLAISMGANVNQFSPKKLTPLFYCVRYGSTTMVENLLTKGADVLVKDQDGNSIWKYAIENPQLEIVEKLLSIMPPVSQERIMALDPRYPAEEEKMISRTVPDYMIELFTVSVDKSPTGDPRSWQVMGKFPDPDEYGMTLLRILQSGTSFSPDCFALGLCVHAHVIELPLDPFYRSFQGRVGQILLGAILPEAMRNEIEQYRDVPIQSEENPCILCNHGISDDDRISLSCGHQFHTSCIKSYLQPPNPLEIKSCPCCFRQVGRDLLSSKSRSLCASIEDVSIKALPVREAGFRIKRQCRGPALLSEEQLDLELGASNVVVASDASRTSKIDALLGRPCRVWPTFRVLELSASSSLATGSMQFMAPKLGPAFITVMVKGVPVLACLSPYSVSTVVSPDFVKNFGLKRYGPESSDFVQGQDAQPKKSRAFKNLVVEIGEIQVHLNSAICVASKTIYPLQLGRDFFAAAAWTRLSTTCLGKNKDIFCVADGVFQTESVPNSGVSELRYYARDGKSFRTPLLHLPIPGENTSFPVVTLKDSAVLVECEWCCRYFPRGCLMQSCGLCDKLGRTTYYCNNDCRENASRIHTHEP